MADENMVNKKTWKEFHSTGLLWFVNTILHTFGWAIVFQWEKDEIVGVYPARVKFRGFSSDVNTANYIKLSQYMDENSKALLKETQE